MFKTNEYFDGQVASIAFQGETLPATVGVIAPGEFSFDTNKHETMTIVSGSLEVKFDKTAIWQTFNAGQSFEVPANSVFNVKAASDTAYLCTYA